MNKDTAANHYDVETVHRTLELIAMHGDLRAFLAHCRDRGFKLTAPPDLVDAALDAMRDVPQIKTASPGGCPACPPAG